MDKKDKTKKEVGKKPPKVQGDYLTRLIFIQCVVCILIFSAIFAICKTNGETYKQMKISFGQMMQKSYDTKGVAQKLKTVGQMVFLPMDEPITEKTTEEITKATEEVTETTTEKPSETTEAETEKPKVQTVVYSKNNLKSKILLPVEGRWSSYFGERTNPVTGVYTFHNGLDIAASEGTNIKAALDGKVKTADYTSANGNYVVMEHGNVTTTYCHCSKLLVKEGNVIRQGETIALVGSTGNSTGPHLHFEIKVDGELIDPASVFERNEV